MLRKILIFLLFMLFIISCKNIDKPVTTIQFFHNKQKYINEINDIVSVFHNKYPEIIVEIETVPVDPDSVLKTRFESGDSPDIMILSNQLINNYANTGYLSDLTKEKCTGRIFSMVRTGMTYNNKIFGFPLNMTGIGVIYNKSVFSKNNISIPKSYNELKTDCEILKKSKIIPFFIPSKDALNQAYLFSLAHSISLNLSGVGYSGWIREMNSGKGSFGSTKFDELVKVMDFYKQYSGYKEINKDSKKQMEDLNEGKYAMIFDSLEYIQDIKIDCGFFALPLTGNDYESRVFCEPDSAIALSAKSAPEKNEAAKKLLDFLSSDQGTRLLTGKCRFLPAVHNADVSSLDDPYRNLYKYMQDNKIIPFSFSMYPGNVFEKIRTGTNEFMEGKKSVPEIIRSIDDDWKNKK
jgi:raffinose/stachyose/melibiose transport system substrate-binding protein